MDPERRGRVRDPLLVAGVRFLDVKLLEFFERFIKHDVPVKHVFNYCFQAGAYLHRFFVLICLCQKPERERGQLTLFCSKR